MQSFFTLFRRTAAALGAIAAMTVTGPATAQTMSITLSGATGNNCTYSTMSVEPNGGLRVNCTTQNSPGTFTLSAVTSLSTNSTSTATQIRVLRTGGSSGSVTVPFTAQGACTAQTTSPVTFDAGSTTAQSIIVETGASSGTCRVAIQAPSDGTLGSPNSRDISVVDPDANVSFAFAASQPASASVGGSNVSIVVTRTGGSNNEWRVPVNVSGSLTSGGNIIAGAGSLAPSELVFPAGSSSASLTFDPPNATPGAPALPATLVISLGQPTTTATTTQQGTANDSHSIQLNGPAVGCPAEETSATSMMAAFGSGTALIMPAGQVKTFVLPEVNPTNNQPLSPGGTFWMSAGTSTFPIGTPYHFEVHINKCKGLVQKPATTDLCYGAYSTKTSTWSRKWYNQLVPGNQYLDTIAEVKARGCWAPKSEGPWYVNIRYTYPACDAKIGGVCGWNYQWKLQ